MTLNRATTLAVTLVTFFGSSIAMACPICEMPFKRFFATPLHAIDEKERYELIKFEAVNYIQAKAMFDKLGTKLLDLLTHQVKDPTALHRYKELSTILANCEPDPEFCAVAKEFGHPEGWELTWFEATGTIVAYHFPKNSPRLRKWFIEKIKAAHAAYSQEVK